MPYHSTFWHFTQPVPNWEVHFSWTTSTIQHAIPVSPAPPTAQKNCSRQSSIPVVVLRSSKNRGNFFFTPTDHFVHKWKIQNVQFRKQHFCKKGRQARFGITKCEPQLMRAFTSQNPVRNLNPHAYWHGTTYRQQLWCCCIVVIWLIHVFLEGKS